MANEIRTTWTTGQTLYGCVFRQSDAKVWYPSGQTWETWGTGSRTAANYNSISMVEVASGSGYYTGNFPTDLTTEAVYDVQLRRRAGATPADTDQIVGIIAISWTGATAYTETAVPATATELVNYALATIGGASEEQGSFQISSLYDGSDIANLALVIYPQVRKEVLCRADWAEATKFADLGAAVSGLDQADWEYAFNLPNDYLGRCKQIHESYWRSSKNRYRWEYDKVISQGRLYTNHYSNADNDSAYIKYVFNLTDQTKFSPLLFRAIATKLAAELSAPLLSDKGSRRFALLSEYERLALPLAIGEMLDQQGDDEDEGEYTALTCRTN